jgi:hypothetical protein
MYKNKEKAKQYAKEYFIKNRERIREYRIKHYYKDLDNSRREGRLKYHRLYQKNREYYLLRQRIYRKNNRLKMNAYQKKIRERCLKSWEGYIPKKTNCEICGKEIFFNNHNRTNAIHFDHRKEGCIIKSIPIIWLRSHINNNKNRKIWESCNFGKLCKRCNAYLPTKNRQFFIHRLNLYFAMPL